MNTKTTIAVIIIILIIIIAIIAFAMTGKTTPAVDNSMASMENMQDMPGMASPTPTPDTGTTTSAVSVSVNAGSTTVKTSVGTTKNFTITASNFSFAPKQISVKKGDTVKITFKNANGYHDFHIDEFNVAASRIQGGQSETVTFVADKAGSFQYYCSVANHRAMGMWGTLTVTE